MKQKEFEQIIKPLSLLDENQRKFIETALLNNFKGWKKDKKYKSEIPIGFLKVKKL